MSIVVNVNGEDRPVSDGATVEQLVLDTTERSATEPDRGGRGVAVAVNGEVVPRSLWKRTRLGPGARVEILRAVGGG